MTHPRLVATTLTLMLLGACDGDVDAAVGREAVAGRSDADRAPAAAAATQPPVPVGEPLSVPALAGGQMQEAAAVVQLHSMPDQNAKLFGVGGGDPAMNGLQTYLALYVDAAEGWRVYPVGDFESWRVTEEGPNRIVLDVSESRLDPATGEIGTAARRLIVGFAPVARTPPANITVTPAR